MNANTSWKPRILLQDALAISASGEVLPLNKSGQCSTHTLLLLNRHEFTPEGVREAAIFSKGRVSLLARAFASELADAGPATFFEALGGQPTPENAGSAQRLYQAFNTAKPEDRAEIIRPTLGYKLDAIIAEPEKILAKAAPQVEKYKDGLMQKIFRVVDAVEDFALGAAMRLLKRSDGDGLDPVKALVTGTGLLGLGFLLKPGEAIMNLEPIGALYAAGGAIAATFVTGAISQVRKHLLGHPPEVANGKEVVEQIQEALAQAPERLQRISAKVQPQVIAATDRVYIQPNDSVPVTRMLGYAKPSSNSVWIHSGLAGQKNLITNEELEHIVNDAVGFSSKEWNSAAKKDILTVQGAAFVTMVSRKPLWVLEYSSQNWGVELLEELNRHFESATKTKPAEEVFKQIEAALPESGQLFRIYKTREEALFPASPSPKGEESQPGAGAEQKAHGQQAAASETREAAASQTEDPPPPSGPTIPSHLPKDFKARDANYLKELGRGNTTNFGHRF
jgi:hypothetical protein